MIIISGFSCQNLSTTSAKAILYRVAQKLDDPPLDGSRYNGRGLMLTFLIRTLRILLRF